MNGHSKGEGEAESEVISDILNLLKLIAEATRMAGTRAIATAAASVTVPLDTCAGAVGASAALLQAAGGAV